MDGFCTITLGCKLNRFDSAAIEGELARRGLAAERDPARAAVVVVNTCTVTAKADAEARKLIRRIRRENPGCRLLVTGCYAEHAAETLRRMDGVDLVFGNRDKPALGGLLDGLGIGHRVPPEPDRGCDAALGLPPALHFGDRARAFLKVQEGCRLACSYCIIPAVRGTSRSVAPETVCRAAAGLFEQGYPEIVLTGVNVGDYGRDLTPSVDLAELLRRLLAIAPGRRIRLNSLEPRTVTDEIVELLAAEDDLASHLQVPLQSGASSVLRAMRRNYGPVRYLERLRRLRLRVPDIGLGADVIVGFPGESDENFRETCELVEAADLNYLHVFSWSARPGTPAAELPDRVDPAVIRERSRILRALGARRSLAFRRRFEGRTLDAVVLGPGRPRHLRALTGNFIEVELPEGSAERGRRLDVRLGRATRERTPALPVPAS